MRVKQEHLDKIVSNPFNGTTISLRVLEKRMYKYFQPHYSQFFEEDCVCGKCDIILCGCECHTKKKVK